MDEITTQYYKTILVFEYKIILDLPGLLAIKRHYNIKK